MVRLNISKELIGGGLKFLRTLGAIKEVEGPDVRRTYYEADIELKKLVGASSGSKCGRTWRVEKIA